MLFDGGKGNGVKLFKEGFESESSVECEEFGTAAEYEVLSGIDPLFLYWFEEGRSSSAEETGSFEESDLVPLHSGGFCGGDSRQSSADDA